LDFRRVEREAIAFLLDEPRDMHRGEHGVRGGGDQVGFSIARGEGLWFCLWGVPK
jgi:hypothetical protein